jgi:hypothetical protein
MTFQYKDGQVSFEDALNIEKYDGRTIEELVGKIPYSTVHHFDSNIVHTRQQSRSLNVLLKQPLSKGRNHGIGYFTLQAILDLDKMGIGSAKELYLLYAQYAIVGNS